MPVYFIVQEKVLDPEGMAAYGKLAGPTLEGVNVKALAVDDDVQTIEGEWHGSRVVVLEFDSEESFRGWYDSPGYQEALKLRLAATDSRGALVKGLG
jgi:uncharacterized protein (DUF1330 family)